MTPKGNRAIITTSTTQRDNKMSQAQVAINRFQFNAFALFDKEAGFRRKDGSVYYYNDGSMLNFFAGSLKLIPKIGF